MNTGWMFALAIIIFLTGLFFAAWWLDQYEDTLDDDADLIAHLAPCERGEPADVIEFPRAPGWTTIDVLRTVAQIEAL